MILLLLGIFVTLFYIHFIWNNWFWKRLGVPHNPPKFFVGNTPSGLSKKRNVFYDIDDVYQKFRGKSRFCGFFSFRKPNLLVLDPSLAHEILVTNFNKFMDNDFGEFINKDVDPILGANPFFLNGHDWKDRRNEATPAFTTARLRAMYPIITKVCGDLSEYIDKEIRIVGNDGMDARELFARYTTDVVCNCVFALDAGSLKDQDPIIRKKAREIFTPSLRVILKLILHEMCPGLHKLLRIPLISKDCEQFFAKVTRDAVDFRRKSGEEKMDVMQFLLNLQKKKNLNDVHLGANAITFFLDGFESSSVSLSLIMFEIARSKRVQDKLRAEIFAAEEKSELTMDSIAGLPYLDQAIHEALRLNSPIVAMTKLTTGDVEIPLQDNGDSKVTIPSGTLVYIPIQSIHRDSENYQDALEFYPERFDEETGGVKAFKDKGMFLGFGDGPRICLGMKLALTQIKAGIVEILRNFEVTVNEKTQVPLVMDPNEFINVPIGKVWLDFKRL